MNIEKFKEAMKKYKKEKNFMNKIELTINPAIELKQELLDMIIKFKVKLQAFQKDDEVIEDLYDLMCEFLNDEMVNEVMKSTFELDFIREFKLKKILKRI